MNRSYIRTKLSKLFTHFLLVIALLMAEIGMLSAPALADFQLPTALHFPLATVSRQSMAAKQNRAGNFAQTKGQLDNQLTNTVTDIKIDIQDATEGAVKTAKRKASTVKTDIQDTTEDVIKTAKGKANTDTKKLEVTAEKAKNRAKQDIGQVQDAAEELGETIQDKTETAIDTLQ